ncbi:MAG: isopentenyl transferase family protein, partial [Chloroflexota bacterium]|nr:isopentenyl transferase family protein [Chloroflexota bacterium]
MNCLVAIVGPTAVGKTELALRLAQELQVEIINADSRQVYRYMDIGTGKPTSEQMAVAPHHIIDIINPDENFNLAMYHQ